MQLMQVSRGVTSFFLGGPVLLSYEINGPLEGDIISSAILHSDKS